MCILIKILPMSFFFVFFLFLDAKSQNPFDTSTFNEKRPTYVSPPIDEIRNARSTITSAIVKNKNEYYMFVDQVFKEMGEDPDLYKYKCRKYAILKFFEKLDKYTENDNWTYMSNDLAKAKSEYYEDLINYQQIYMREQEANAQFVNKKIKLKDKWRDSTIPLRAEPSNSSNIITYIKNDWKLMVKGYSLSYFKVKISLNDIEGYVYEDYFELINQE